MEIPPKKSGKVLVESRSWRDGNLKFGPNCDLEVDNLEKIEILSTRIIHLQITIWAKFKFPSRQLLLSTTTGSKQAFQDTI